MDLDQDRSRRRSRLYVFASLASMLAAVLAFGCTDSPVHPVTHAPTAAIADGDIQVSVIPSPFIGDPEHPVAIETRVTNAGAADVWHCSGCGCGNGARLTILGPDGKPVLWTDPRAPAPLCPDALVTLGPAGVLEVHASFTGILYEPDSPVYPSPTFAAPQGTYTAVANFPYSKSTSGASLSVTSSATFDWNP